jgi:hypothetical protein
MRTIEPLHRFDPFHFGVAAAEHCPVTLYPGAIERGAALVAVATPAGPLAVATADSLLTGLDVMYGPASVLLIEEYIDGWAHRFFYAGDTRWALPTPGRPGVWIALPHEGLSVLIGGEPAACPSA